MSLKKQASLQNSFGRMVNFCKNIPSQTNISDLQVRTQSVKQLYEDFKLVQSEIEETCGADTISGQFEIRGQIEDYYYFCTAALSEAINVLNARAANNQQQNQQTNNVKNTSQDVKLPLIELTAFSGKYEDWPSFKDLYSTLIHNNTALNNVQKLHYLKANIEGDAYSLLKSIHVTEANYDQAWKRLTDRYDHKRYIVDSHLKIFLNQPHIQMENHEEIKTLIDKSSEIVRALQVQGLPVNQWDAFLVHVVVSKLDNETHKQWELNMKKDELPTFTALEAFLEARWQSLEMISKANTPTASEKIKSNYSANNRSQHQQSSSYNKNQGTYHAHPALVSYTSKEKNPAVSSVCSYCCKLGHSVWNCPEYNSLSCESKIEVIKGKKLCFNCLGSGHDSKECRSKANCYHCGKRHHSSIHKGPKNNSTNEASFSPRITNEVPNQVRSNNVMNPSINHMRVLLATALVKVKMSNGSSIIARALIDSGGNIVAQNHTNAVKVEIESLIDPSFKLEVNAYTLKVVTGDSPSVSIERKEWTHLKGIKLADQHYDSSAPIQILLGAEVYEEIIMEGIIPKVDHSPTAMNSRLGWLLFGKVVAKSYRPQSLKCFHVVIRNESLDATLKSFWEMEETPPVRKLTVKEQQAEDILQQHITRNEEGRYVVPLPFDPSKSSSILGESKRAALCSLYRIEKRFQLNEKLKGRYVSYIKNLIESNHIELVPKNRQNVSDPEKFYLPHHPVVKESSLTTKLRVVFNASRKSTSGVSLNDKLLIGPRIQDDLFTILIRWRKHKIVFIADIEKMYRQVKITENHRDFQRLLWRFSTTEPISEYRITTVIDGTASAQFLATRALRQLAMDSNYQYAEASQIMLNDFYVDDLSSGSHSVTSAIKVQNDLINALQQGGFILRKWLSNSQEVMDNVPKENQHEPEALVELLDKGIKTLGVFWNQREDCFEFKVSTSNVKNHISKREVLSDIAKLFDPIGWLSPTTILAKIFLQKLWSIKDLGWDDKLPNDIFIEWKSYRNQLSALESIKIPRWIGTEEIVNMQLHGFSDASNSAYAAVVYSRVTMSNGNIKINLLSGKTRVAPLKVISIPKLELCGCVLLSSLIAKIRNSFNVPAIETSLYSDSTISLAWITSHPNHWNIFVANRITEIQQLTDSRSWHFVDTNQNPADCASRGVIPTSLREHPLWWQGPSWLKQTRNEWPIQTQENFETDLERRKIIRTLHVHGAITSSPLQEKVKKYSDLIKLQKIVARMLRWIPKSITGPKLSTPNASELQGALRALIKHSQMNSFGSEIECCLAEDELQPKSKLAPLRPFLDKYGILRVGGRLAKSELSFQAKHPIILPKRDHLTKLIIEQAHMLTIHGGPTLMSAFLHKYWIFGKSEQIKRVISNCIRCFPYNCKPQQQVMADLPKDRVIPHRTFLHSGVDFAGPVTTKTFIGRSRGKFANATTKGYVAVFVCFSTKAIHIEFVSDLTSKAFIAAFERFTARRGKISDLYSDCGTNFVGADRILQEQLQKLASDAAVQNHIAQDGTNWHFNPPASPHFGGLWESGVKSIKYHLKRLLSRSVFNFEEMITILCKIEACLNSRPLCPLNDDINDNSYLTPGHFILGEAPMTVPEPNLLGKNINRLSRWQLVQRIYQEFWKCWSHDYLSKLQQRPKWRMAQENVHVGQLVLYREDNVPPAKWPMARILDIHPGDDGKTRVVTIKTSTTILKRPIRKISVLPIVDNYENLQINSEVLKNHLVKVV